MSYQHFYLVISLPLTGSIPVQSSEEGILLCVAVEGALDMFYEEGLKQKLKVGDKGIVGNDKELLESQLDSIVGEIVLEKLVVLGGFRHRHAGGAPAQL